MKLALIQMTSEKGAVEDNLRRMIAFLDKAAGRAADIVCFPEMNITGYVAPRKFPEAVITWDDPRLDPLYAWSENSPASIIAGIVEHKPDGLPFISQAVIRAGKVTAAYRKINVVDDEVVMFSPGPETQAPYPSEHDKRPLYSAFAATVIPAKAETPEGARLSAIRRPPQTAAPKKHMDTPIVHDHDGMKFGVLVCADQDREDLFSRRAQSGARIVLLPSAPGLFGAQATRDWRSGYDWWRDECMKGIGMYAKRLGIWTASTSQSGRTIDEDFPGGGYIYDHQGRLAAQTRDWSEGMILHDIPL